MDIKFKRTYSRWWIKLIMSSAYSLECLDNKLSKMLTTEYPIFNE